MDNENRTPKAGEKCNRVPRDESEGLGTRRLAPDAAELRKGGVAKWEGKCVAIT